MSKIHKALEILRDSKGANPGAQERAKAYVAKHGPNLGVRANGVPESRQEAKSSSASARQYSENCEEPLVTQSIKVCYEDLRNCGLQPDEVQLPVIADQFRRAKRPVLQCAFGDDLPGSEDQNIIMVTSAMPGAGKTFCSFNLAKSIALERDFGSVLVDADVLKFSLTKGLSLEERPGLIDYLLDRNLSLEDVLVRIDEQDIVVLPAGKKHTEATELLSSRRMAELVAELAARFPNRAVIFDTPPILVTNEAHALARNMGQIIMVIEARNSSQESVMQALGSLDRDKPINAILNKSRTAAASGYHGDDYGYYPHFEKAR